VREKHKIFGWNSNLPWWLKWTKRRCVIVWQLRVWNH